MRAQHRLPTWNNLFSTYHFPWVEVPCVTMCNIYSSVSVTFNEVRLPHFPWEWI
jgi:hypothetical protein